MYVINHYQGLSAMFMRSGGVVSLGDVVTAAPCTIAFTGVYGMAHVGDGHHLYDVQP